LSYSSVASWDVLFKGKKRSLIAYPKEIRPLSKKEISYYAWGMDGSANLFVKH